MLRRPPICLAGVSSGAGEVFTKHCWETVGA